MWDWRSLPTARAALIGALGFASGFLSSQVLADESPTPEQAAALANVPKDAQQYYLGYWYSTKLVADPLANWQPHKAPWQICHNDSYLGNSWRANLVAELQDLTSQLAKQGLAKDKLIVTNSNGDINLELTQLKTQVAQGCDLIMMYPGSETGLCSGIRDAFDRAELIGKRSRRRGRCRSRSLPTRRARHNVITRGYAGGTRRSWTAAFRSAFAYVRRRPSTRGARPFSPDSRKRPRCRGLCV
jgi:hypothetical protein